MPEIQLMTPEERGLCRESTHLLEMESFASYGLSATGYYWKMEVV